MRIFRFDKEVGKPVEDLENDNFILSRILVDESPETLNLVCAHFDSGDSTGRQQVMINQLFLLVQGEGWCLKIMERKFQFRQGKHLFGRLANGMK